jgi:hypothetical protein
VAILYRGEITPSKIELVSAWAPLQSWSGSLDLGTLSPAGAYRFDDPQGEVGIETLLVRGADGQVFQVPLTYRGAAMNGAETALITRMQHSVLGERWVYDGCGDPAYAQALATAILTGGNQAELEVVTDEGTERREATTKVAGNGVPGSPVPHVGAVTYRNVGATTIISSGDLELIVNRVIDVAAGAKIPQGQILVGTWPEQDAPTYLASARSI